MATGRYKLGPDGTYYDPNDSGPDQASPDQISAYQQQQGGSAPAPPAPPDGGYQPGNPPPYLPTGGTPTPAPPMYYAGGSQTFDESAPGGQPSVSFDPSKASPTTGINGGGGAPNIPSATVQGAGLPISGGSSNTLGITSSYPGSDNDPLGVNYSNYLRSKQGLPPLTAEQWGWPAATSTTGGTTPNQPGQSGPWNGAGVPAGFDASKWNDPTKNDPKYDIGHMVAGGWTNDSIAAYMQQHPQEFQGFNLSGKDTITDAQGNVFDFRNGVGNDPKGLGTAQWTQTGGPGFGGAAGAGGVGTAANGGGAAAGSGIGGSVSGLATSGAPGSNSAFSDQVRQLLLGQIGSATNPVTDQDPAIKAEMDAQTAGADRIRRDQRASDAERAAMNGLLNGGQSSGSFDQNVANGFSQEQQQLAGVRADLFTREIQSRRQYAQGLLNQAMQSGDAESARQLQAYLAQLDNAYRYAALAQNQGQFNDQFGLQAGQFQYQKDRDLAQYGGGY